MRVNVAEALLTDIQDAFLHPDSWTSVLDRVSESVGATGATILSLSDRTSPSPTSTAIQEGMEAYRRSEWCATDLRLRGIPKLLRTGIVVDQDFSSADEIRRHPYYADFLKRLGLRWFAGIAFAAGGETWCLALQRSPSQGPFEPDEQAALHRLCAPLSSAGSIASQVMQARANGMIDGLDAIGCAAALLDVRGRLIRHNATAAPYFLHDLRIERGVLVPHRGGRDPLARHIAAVLSGRAQDRHPVTVPREGGRGLLVSVRPLHGDVGGFFAPAHLLLTLVDLDRRFQGDVSGLLRATYRLTSSEARIALHVGSGGSVQTTADRLGLSVGTVRSALKQIFAKCDVSRQAELVGLLTQVTTAAHLAADITIQRL